MTQWRQTDHGTPTGVSIPGKFDLKINRSMKTPWQHCSAVACSYSSAPGYLKLFLGRGNLKTSQYERTFFVKQCQTTCLLNHNICSHLNNSLANSCWRISSPKYFPIVALPLYWLHSKNEYMRLALTKTRLKWTNCPLILEKATGKQTNFWETYMPFACCFWYSIGFPSAAEQDK